MILYDITGRTFRSDNIIRELPSGNISLVRSMSCQELNTTNNFACVFVSGSASITELSFEFYSTNMSVRVYNETSYFPYKDYIPSKIILHKNYFIVTARGLTESPHAILAYKRVNAGGNQTLFAGVSYEYFGFKTIDQIDVAFYDLYEDYLIHVQPFNSKNMYILRLGNFKLAVRTSDITVLRNAIIYLDGAASTRLIDIFYTQSSSESSSAPEQATQSTGSSLLVFLIAFVIFLFAVIFGGIAYVVFKTNTARAATKQNGTGTSTNKPFDNPDETGRSFDVERL
jgi:hypothetical protein